MLFGLVEELFVDCLVSGETHGVTFVQIVGRESSPCAGTLDVHLDEQNLGDRIKGSSGFHFVDVAQNTVALEQQVLKFLAAERAGTVLYRLDAFGISPVFGVGEVVDRYRFAGCSGDEFENGSLALVMGNEEFATGGTGITLALVVIPKMDVHGLGLAFNNNNGGLASRCGVNNNVSPGATPAMLSLPFLIHLLERVAVVVVKMLNELLADTFFGCGFEPASLERAESNPPVYRRARGRELFHHRRLRGQDCPMDGCGPGR